MSKIDYENIKFNSIFPDSKEDSCELFAEIMVNNVYLKKFGPQAMERVQKEIRKIKKQEVV